MPTVATSAYEVIADALATVINAEFTDLGIVVIHDRLHESLGRKRREVGIAPVEDSIPMKNGLVLETLAEIRFYDFWTQEISPETAVDPRIITNYAERLRRSVKAASAAQVGTGVMWYFDVRRVQYLSDPTGNATRFHAQVRGFGNNTALVETSG